MRFVGAAALPHNRVVVQRQKRIQKNPLPQLESHCLFMTSKFHRLMVHLRSHLFLRSQCNVPARPTVALRPGLKAGDR